MRCAIRVLTLIGFIDPNRSMTAIILCSIMYGTVGDVSYEHLGNSTEDELWAFFFGISTMCFLFGVQAVQPDIQANLRDKPDPKKEVWVGTRPLNCSGHVFRNR